MNYSNHCLGEGGVLGPASQTHGPKSLGRVHSLPYPRRAPIYNEKILCSNSIYNKVFIVKINF